MSLGASGAFLALLTSAADLRADLLHHDGIATTFARSPRRDELALSFEQAAASLSSSETRGVATLESAYGLTFFGSSSVRVVLPVVESGDSVRAGSLRASLGVPLQRLFVRSRLLALRPSIEPGIITPSFASEPLRVAGLSFAEDRGLPFFGASLPVEVRPLGVKLVAWTSTPAAALNAELAYTTMRDRTTLRAGWGARFDKQPERVFAGVGLRLGERAELGAFATRTVDEPASATVASLSARWSLPEVSSVGTASQGDVRKASAYEVGDEPSSLAVRGKTTIVEVGAQWCEPCALARPTLAKLSERADVAVRIVDADECPRLVALHRVTALPTFFVFDERGELVRRFSGVPSDLATRLLP